MAGVGSRVAAASSCLGPRVWPPWIRSLAALDPECGRLGPRVWLPAMLNAAVLNPEPGGPLPFPIELFSLLWCTDRLRHLKVNPVAGQGMVDGLGPDGCTLPKLNSAGGAS
eukprot:359517-Chlamydomonas_euryale.AAC.17